jgi:hypothetical protein
MAHAREKSKSVRLWGWSVALGMFLIPFWDWIPTVAMHRYYCASEAGFWIYKTQDQWMRENPGTIEKLARSTNMESGLSPNWPVEIVRGKEVARVNQRFAILYINHLSSKDETVLPINVWRWRTDVIDKETGEVVARKIDFSTGNGLVGGEPPLKFWLQSTHCRNNVDSSKRLTEFLGQIKGGAEK